MKRVLPGFVLTLLIAVPAWSQPGSRYGNLGITTAKVEGTDLLLEHPVAVEKVVTRTVIKKIDGKDVPVTVQEKVLEVRMQFVKHPLKDVSAYGGDGKAISAEQLTARLKEPTAVLIWGAGARPRLVGEKDWKNPPFRGLLRDDAIVLELPPGDGPIEKLPAPPEKIPQPIPR